LGGTICESAWMGRSVHAQATRSTGRNARLRPPPPLAIPVSALDESAARRALRRTRRARIFLDGSLGACPGNAIYREERPPSAPPSRDPRFRTSRRVAPSSDFRLWVLVAAESPPQILRRPIGRNFPRSLFAPTFFGPDTPIFGAICGTLGVSTDATAVNLPRWVVRRTPKQRDRPARTRIFGFPCARDPLLHLAYLRRVGRFNGRRPP
jgi:hypothetical protein